MTVSSFGRPVGLMRGVSARSRVYETFLAVSALTTLGIGVRAQLAFDDFATVSYSPMTERRIEAYRDVVRETSPFLTTSDDAARPERARRVARQWIEGGRQGLLRPLEPTAFEDDLSVPVKSEILRANMALTMYLNQASQGESDHGRWKQAAEDALLAYQAANVVKYSDFDAIGQLGLTQRKSLRILTNAMPHLPADERHKVGDGILESRKSRAPLSRLAALGRTHYVDYLRRQGVDVSESIVKAKPVYYDMIDGDGSDRIIVDGAKLGPYEDDDRAREYLSGMRLAYKAESFVNEMERDVLKRVENPNAPLPKRMVFAPLPTSKAQMGKVPPEMLRGWPSHMPRAAHPTFATPMRPPSYILPRIESNGADGATRLPYSR